MNTASWWLLTLLMVCLIGLLIHFNRRKQRLLLAHGQCTGDFSTRINQNQQQIQQREAQLSNYDFQKYNLKEVLLPNPEVIL